jgi:hypothetical protein
MSKRKEKRLQRDEKTGRKLIVARHLECTSYIAFDIIELRPDGKEGEIGDGSFQGLSLELVTPMLNQLAQSLGDCEIKWASFADLAMEELEGADRPSSSP